MRCDLMCDGCGLKGRLGPVLTDAAWVKIAEQHERLCDGCMRSRAADRGVTLTLADLWPCPWNVALRPASWFDRFLDAEPATLVPEVWFELLRQKGVR